MNQSRKRTAAQIARDRELRQIQADEEAEQDKRTEAMRAIIKDENLERKRIEGREVSHAKPFERRYKTHATIPDGRGRFGWKII